MNAVSGWTIIVEVPKHAAEIFDRALARFRPRPHPFESPETDLWRVEAFAISPPDETALVGAVAIASELSNIPEPDIRVAPLPAIDWVAENQNLFNRFPLAGSLFIPRITTELCPPEVRRSPSTQVPLSERDRTAPPLAACLRWTDYRETHPRVAF